MEKAMVAGSLPAYKGKQWHANGALLCFAALLLSSTHLTAQEQAASTALLRQNSIDENINRPLDNYLNRLNQVVQSIEDEANENNSAQPRTQTSAATQTDRFAVPEPRRLNRDFSASDLELPTIDASPLEMGDEIASDEASDLSAGTINDATDDSNIITGATSRTAQAAPRQATPRQAASAQSSRSGNNLLRVRNEEKAAKALPLESNIVRRDGSPYAATGVPLGVWRFRPTLSSGVEVTSGEGRTETSSITTFTLNGLAEWSNTQLNLDSDLSITTPIGSTNGNDTQLEGAVDLSGTHTISNTIQAFGNVGYAANNASATGGLDTDFAVETTQHIFNLNAGLRTTGAKTQITGTIGATREAYDDAQATTDILPQDDRNNTVLSGALRLGYEVSPSLTPFAQMIVGRRIMDNSIDSLGFERSGYEFDATIGTEINLGEKLRGEISAGWLGTTYDDQRLESLNAIAFRGLVNWSPQRNSNLELAATSSLDAGSSTTISASTTYGLSATATHIFRDNLTGSAQLGYSFRDSDNGADENLISARMDATYWFNRTFGLTGNISHQIADSAASGSQSSTTLRLGVTVQR